MFKQLLVGLSAALLLYAGPGLSASPMTTSVIDAAGNELPVQRWPVAEGEQVVVWILPQSGARPIHARFAEGLQQRGVEVWQIDLLDALFLPRINESMRELDGSSVAAIIREAHAQTGRSVLVVTSGRPSIQAIRGLRQWQLSEPGADYLLGAALYFPNLMLATPVAGEPAIYIDEAYATTLPVFLYQPELGVYRWHLADMVATLQSGGSPVFARLLPEVRDFFYLRRDETTEVENRLIERLPEQLIGTAQLFARLPRPQQVADLPDRGEAIGTTRRGLVELDGSVQTQPIELPDHLGERQRLADYDGQVVLLNFWASWCPPCVEEIPSMNRMAELLGDGFAIVSVNFQESAEHIGQFMREVQVDFPVLMDMDGRVSAQWRVFAFPSSFILDRQGRLRYSVNSAIEWDETEVIETVRRLMDE